VTNYEETTIALFTVRLDDAGQTPVITHEVLLMPFRVTTVASDVERSAPAVIIVLPVVAPSKLTTPVPVERRTTGSAVVE